MIPVLFLFSSIITPSYAVADNTYSIHNVLVDVKGLSETNTSVHNPFYVVLAHGEPYKDIDLLYALFSSPIRVKSLFDEIFFANTLMGTYIHKR